MNQFGLPLLLRISGMSFMNFRSIVVSYYLGPGPHIWIKIDFPFQLAQMSPASLLGMSSSRYQTNGFTMLYKKMVSVCVSVNRNSGVNING